MIFFYRFGHFRIVGAAQDDFIPFFKVFQLGGHRFDQIDPVFLFIEVVEHDNDGNDVLYDLSYHVIGEKSSVDDKQRYSHKMDQTHP